MHTANFLAEMPGERDILENITWWILLMRCVLRARYDSAVTDTVVQYSTNHRTSANLARGVEDETAIPGDSVRESTG